MVNGELGVQKAQQNIYSASKMQYILEGTVCT